MAKKKHEELMADKQGKAARAEDKAQKKALEVAGLVTKGATLVQSLAQEGTARLKRLTLAEIDALLAHADPLGTACKPKTKNEGMQRVRALKTVTDALGRHAAAAAAPAAPDAPAGAPDPVIGSERHFIGSVGSSEAVQRPEQLIAAANLSPNPPPAATVPLPS